MARRALPLLLLALLGRALAVAGAPDARSLPFAVEGKALVGIAPLRAQASPAAARASATQDATQDAARDTVEQDSSRQAGGPVLAEGRLPARFHAQRRETVLKALPSDGVAVLFSSPRRTREGDVRHAYRQDSNLHYLTGTPNPGSVLMLAPGRIAVGGKELREVLFVPPRTAQSQMWKGPRLGPARAERLLGVEQAVTNGRFAEVVQRVARDSTRRFFHLPLPYGIEEDSELAGQVAAFRGAARLMPEASSRLTRRAAEAMRTVDRPAAFQTLQRQFRRRLSPDAFQSAFLREAYRQFAGSDSLAAWTRWRSARLGPSRADGQSLERLLAQMRVEKTPAEQRLMRRVAGITARAQKAALRTVEPGAREYAVEAAAEYVFQKNGARAAFPSVVGSGPNTSVLQYHTNRRQMQAGELVVVDVGAERHGYTADVTRTAPVDGTFSEEERAIYELVLRAQKAAIQAARPGNNFRDPQQVTRRVLGEGLVELGLLDNANNVGRYFTHPAAHYLGRSVHDAGRGGPLEAGTVLAVEPGLYLPASEDLPKKWHHVGVRIEDVVLVTEDGPEVLSKSAPRAPQAVEALMREPREL
jgi:Xaa-Pro aminopeptidase